MPLVQLDHIVEVIQVVEVEVVVHQQDEKLI